MNPSDTIASTNGNGSEAWCRSWTHLRIDRRSPGYCRVTFDHPPVNAISATTVLELTELVELIEHDADLSVVVFASANPDFYLSDHDAEDATGMDAWIGVLARMSRAPVVSIASIRGRARGAGREFVLACDLRFALRENTFVDDIAARLARLDRDAIARTKSYVGLRPGRAESLRPVARSPAPGES
jgi:1,4-dihydroxy-2-naphthoyl-CoA synthase